jgi:hypothetical protein
MPAPALRDVQASFWRSLHTGEPDPALVGVVLPSGPLEPAQRIDIYQGMYFWRLNEVLREDFPKLALALGDEFDDLVRAYLTRHPSEHPSVRHVGDGLAAFLETDALVRKWPWLPELARLERARVDVFDAPDALPIRASDLAIVAPEAWATLTFSTIPALETLSLRWPVHEVWASPEEGTVLRQTVLRVWRQDFAVFHAAMDDIEVAAFAALRAGAPFGDICDRVADHVDAESAATEAGSLLVRWIEDGLIARFG